MISKLSFLLLTILAFAFFSCGKQDLSEQRGAFEEFAEMVQSGVKPMALSHPMNAAEMDQFFPEAEKIAEKYGVKIQREPELIESSLFSTEAVKDKEVILIYSGNSLFAYENLKDEIEELKAKNEFTGPKREALSRRFGRLLGYPVSRINNLLAENSEFRDLEDFGIKGQELHWYYSDLGKAKAFYGEKLGLKLLSETATSASFLIAGDSKLVLNSISGSGFTGSEPKSVALALLTDDLQIWYDRLLAQKVEIKYTLKVKPEGAHDGFVAVDPEGYLLEFEMFRQHPENEILMPELAQMNPEPTSLGEKFSFRGSVTWLYYKDMLPAQLFVEEQLGLNLSTDQGWAKIYGLSANSYLGLVDGLRGMNTFSPEKLIQVKLILDKPAEWEKYLKTNSNDSIRLSGTFRDPASYTFLFQ
jgi:extradiol dioxygenase family protein